MTRREIAENVFKVKSGQKWNMKSFFAVSEYTVGLHFMLC